MVWFHVCKKLVVWFVQISFPILNVRFVIEPFTKYTHYTQVSGTTCIRMYIYYIFSSRFLSLCVKTSNNSFFFRERPKFGMWMVYWMSETAIFRSIHIDWMLKCELNPLSSHLSPSFCRRIESNINTFIFHTSRECQALSDARFVPEYNKELINDRFTYKIIQFVFQTVCLC